MGGIICCKSFYAKRQKWTKPMQGVVRCKSFYSKWQKWTKPMGVKYVARVFTQGGKNGQNLWGCSMLRMMAKNDKIIGWIRQHKI